MAELTLPAVAKSIHLECKKCAVERYFTVIAHKTSTTAKVQCEVCGATKTYKLPAAAKAPKKTASGLPRKRALSGEAKRNQYNDEYNTLMAATATQEMKKYNMKTKFDINSKIDHPKFGTGFVRTSHTDKIEVVFPDEVRSLVHNRQ